MVYHIPVLHKPSILYIGIFPDFIITVMQYWQENIS